MYWRVAAVSSRPRVGAVAGMHACTRIDEVHHLQVAAALRWGQVAQHVQVRLTVPSIAYQYLVPAQNTSR